MAAQDFKALIKRVRGAVPQRNTIPALGSLLIEARDGRVSLSGTSMSMELSAWSQADIRSEGRLLVPAAPLWGVVDKLPPTRVVTVATEDEGRVNVVSGTAAYRLAVLPPDHYPAWSRPEGGVEFSVERSDLRRVISVVQYAACTIEARYSIIGVCLEADKGVLLAAATDHLRLAEAICPVTSRGFRCAIPNDAAKLLTGFLAIGEGEVHGLASENAVEVWTADAHFRTATLGGEFLSYRDFLDKARRGRVAARVVCKELLGALDRITQIYAGIDVKVPQVTLSFCSDGIALESLSDRINVGVEEIRADVQRAGYSIKVNATYMAQALASFPPDGEVTIVSDEMFSPILLTCGGVDETHLVMPQKL